MTLRILGVSGKKGSGKTTLADALCRHRLLTVRRPLAGPLKEFCVGVFGLDRQACYADDGPRKNAPTRYRWQDMPTPPPPGVRLDAPVTVREFLQYFGSQIVRRIAPDAWVESLTRDAEALGRQGYLCVVDDVRFPNEVRGIRAAGGRVVRLLRAPDSTDRHISETALDDFSGFDATIDNRDMTAEQTHEYAERLVRQWDRHPVISDGATA
jgi:hypothetical protein